MIDFFQAPEVPVVYFLFVWRKVMQGLLGRTVVLVGENIIVFRRGRFNMLEYEGLRPVDSLQDVYVICGEGWISIRSERYKLFGVRLLEGKFRRISVEPVGFYDVKVVDSRYAETVPGTIRETLRAAVDNWSGPDTERRKRQTFFTHGLGSSGKSSRPHPGSS